MNQPGTETPALAQTRGQKPRWLLPALGVLLLILLVIGALLMRLMGRSLTETDVRPIEGEPLTQGQVRPFDPGDSLIAGNPSELPDGPNLTGHPTTEPSTRPEEPNMPDDVARYLEHIRRVEAQRQQMTSDLALGFSMLAEVRGGATLFGEEDKIEGGYQKYIQDWASLSRFFLSVQPPQECRPLFNAYDKMLATYLSSMLRTQKFFGDIVRDPQSAISSGVYQELQKELGIARREVPSLIRKANTEKDAIYKKYGQRADYDITDDLAISLPAF